MATNIREEILSRRQTEAWIAEGRTIVILNQSVLRLDKWIGCHPGGHKPIQHMVGRDATDEVTAMHSSEPLEQMKRFKGGKFRLLANGGIHKNEDEGDNTVNVDDGAGSFDIGRSSRLPRPSIHGTNQSHREGEDGMAFLDSQTQQEIKLGLEKYPAVDPAVQDDIVEKYRQMHSRIMAEGLYECDYTAYAWDLGRCGILLGLMYVFLQRGWYAISAACLGMFWSQLVFIAHDAGLVAITHNFNRGHGHRHDRCGTLQLYYVILAFGRFNLYVQSWIFPAKGQGPRKRIAWWHRWFEIVGNLIFRYWFGYRILHCSIPPGWDRFVFVMVSHMINMPLHAQLTLSHFAMSTTDLGPNESFAQKMLRTTMDVGCPPLLDFYHGGLQFQAIHHLYPRLPKHNLRKVQRLVMEFCREVGIPYALYGFVKGNQKVVGSLAEVSRQAAILAKCQKTVAGDMFHGHH
ncbi:fatty acid desaturase [Paramyrothecium foliicola]|nr:fatty acid desaturase [Paramyrothecium foliicola]